MAAGVNLHRLLRMLSEIERRRGGALSGPAFDLLHAQNRASLDLIAGNLRSASVSATGSLRDGELKLDVEDVRHEGPLDFAAPVPFMQQGVFDLRRTHGRREHPPIPAVLRVDLQQGGGGGRMEGSASSASVASSSSAGSGLGDLARSAAQAGAAGEMVAELLCPRELCEPREGANAAETAEAAGAGLDALSINGGGGGENDDDEDEEEEDAAEGAPEREQRRRRRRERAASAAAAAEAAEGALAEGPALEAVARASARGMRVALVVDPEALAAAAAAAAGGRVRTGMGRAALPALSLTLEPRPDGVRGLDFVVTGSAGVRMQLAIAKARERKTGGPRQAHLQSWGIAAVPDYYSLPHALISVPKPKPKTPRRSSRRRSASPGPPAPRGDTSRALRRRWVPRMRRRSARRARCSCGAWSGGWAGCPRRWRCPLLRPSTATGTSACRRARAVERWGGRARARGLEAGLAVLPVLIRRD